MMNILIYGINYHPELTGIGKYTAELAEYLVNKGHSVWVICAPPYYPYWKVQLPYKPYSWKREIIRDVKVFRTPLYVPAKVTGLSRIILEASFVLGSLPYWMAFLFKKVDIVLCIYPPLIGTLVPLLFSKLKRIPTLYHVQDLQVDLARDLGKIKNKWLMSMLESIEQFTFDHSSSVSTISQGIAARLRNKLPLKNVPIFPNGTNSQNIYPLDKPKEDLKKIFGFNVQDRVVLYAGNIGEKQGVEIVLQVAANLAVSHPKFVFFIVGEGAQKNILEEKVKENGYSNVYFSGLVSENQLNDLLNIADLHIVPQKAGSSDLVMPSKLGPILMAGGVPLIGTDMGSYLYNETQKHDFAFLFNAEDADELIDLLGSIDLEGQELVNKRTNGMAYAREKLENDVILKSFEEFIMGFVKE